MLVVNGEVQVPSIDYFRVRLAMGGWPVLPRSRRPRRRPTTTNIAGTCSLCYDAGIGFDRPLDHFEESLLCGAVRNLLAQHTSNKKFIVARA